MGLDEVAHERGRLVVEGTIQEVATRVGHVQRVHVEMLGETESAAGFFAIQPGCSDVAELEGQVSFAFDGDRTALADLLQRATSQGLRIAEFRLLEADLEQIFMRSTSGRLQ